jgi:hypothetical protein
MMTHHQFGWLLSLLLLAPLAGCEGRTNRQAPGPDNQSTIYTRTQGPPAGQSGQGGADSSTPSSGVEAGSAGGAGARGGDGSAATPGPSNQIGGPMQGNPQDKGTGMGGSDRGSGQAGDEGSARGMGDAVHQPGTEDRKAGEQGNPPSMMGGSRGAAPGSMAEPPGGMADPGDRGTRDEKPDDQDEERGVNGKTR